MPNARAGARPDSLLRAGLRSLKELPSGFSINTSTKRIGKILPYHNNMRPVAVRYLPLHAVDLHLLLIIQKEPVLMKKLSIMLAALLAISAGAACQKKEQKPAAAPAAEAPKAAEGAPAGDAAKPAEGAPAAPAEKK